MRWLLLLLIAIVTFAIVLLVKNPDIIKGFWLWLVGFAGLIMHLFQLVKDFLKRTFSKATGLVKEEKDKLTGNKQVKKA